MSCKNRSVWYSSRISLPILLLLLVLTAFTAGWALPSLSNTIIYSAEKGSASPEANNDSASPMSAGRDFGDAPSDTEGASYPTRSAENGAVHVIEEGFHLGAAVDPEEDGQPNPMATGDDTDGETDDEDGVTFVTHPVPGQQVEIRVEASGNGSLSAWIDWNGDGDWDDAGEQVLGGRSISQGRNRLEIQVPESTEPGQTFARFRFSTAEDLPPTGEAPDGEVEDYRVKVVPGAFQFGVRNEFRSAIRDAPSDIIPQTLIDGFSVQLQAENSAEYNLYGALLQNGEFVLDGFSSPLEATPGEEESISIDCSDETELGPPPPCSVIEEFLGAGSVPPSYALYVPNPEVFENATFSSEGPSRFPEEFQEDLSAASEQGPVLYLAPTGATDETRSLIQTLPLVVVPGTVDLGRAWVPPPTIPEVAAAEYVEFNQAIQNQIVELPTTGRKSVSSPVPILPSKDMVVRYYQMAPSKKNFTVGPDLKVEILSGGSVANTFRIGPNTGQSSISVPQYPGSASRDSLVREMRSDASKTLNYVVPAGRIPQSADQIRLSLDPSLLAGEVQFGVDAGRSLGLEIVPIDPPGNSSEPGRNSIQNQVLRYVGESYPIANLKTEFKSTFQWGGPGFFNTNLLTDLITAHFGQPRNVSGGASFTTMLGVAPSGYTAPPSGNSGRGKCPGKTSWSNLTGSTAAQEIGHNLDLEHISSTHNTGGYGNEPSPYQHGTIGEFDLNASPDETAPGTWGNVGVRAQQSGGSWSLRIIPAGDPDSGNSSDHTHEFMSYGGGFRWISDVIYDRLYDQLNSRGSKCTPIDSPISRTSSPSEVQGRPAAGVAATETAAVQDSDSSQADVLVFTATSTDVEYQQPRLMRRSIPQSRLEQEQSTDGSLTLELIDGNGEVVRSASFAPETVHGHENDLTLAQTAVPYVEDVARIVLRRDGEIVAEREASPNSPDLTLLQPDGDETWGEGTHTISWELGDADGDAPGLLIEYSPDGGETWEPLGLFNPGALPEDNALEVDVGRLADSSGTGTVRVSASDGVNTATDTGTFSFEGGGPDASSSKDVNDDGTKDFGDTGLDATFYGVASSGSVTVRRYSDGPDGTDGITESNVSSYRLTVDASSSLEFDSTKVQLPVEAFSGIGDPSNVTIYKRPNVGSGTFEPLKTTAEMNGTPDDVSDDILYAFTDSFSEFVLASDSEPLPVDMTGLGATLNEQSVQVRWQVASGADDTRFEVQRRSGGGEAWNQIGSVEGRSEKESRSYQFVDSDLPYEADQLSYRVKQVDTDGSTRVSEPVTVDRTVDQVELLGMYPNPAQSRATIRYALPETRDVTLRLYDTLGRQVRTIVDAKKEGRHRSTLNVSKLPSGIYFLRLRAGGTIETKKLTVVR